MDFDLSAEQQQIRDQARRLLRDKCSRETVRDAMEGGIPFSRSLWRTLGRTGFVGAAIPTEFGGVGAGYVEQCVIAEELGRALAPVPMTSSIYLAAECLMIAGSTVQKDTLLPNIASGETIGCVKGT